MEKSLVGVAIGLVVGALGSFVIMRLDRGRDDLPPRGPPQPALTADAMVLRRLLECIEKEILPKTAEQVARGNKVFGAAVLKQGNLKTVIASTNHETSNPIYHGEVYCIEEWAQLQHKPPPCDSVFLATHEPCCLCISAIVWAGFKQCYYLYPYETTRDQGIPHDLKIMHELWRVERYQDRNEFCATAGLMPLIEALPSSMSTEKTELRATVQRITGVYENLAIKYHSEKADNPANTMAFS